MTPALRAEMMKLVEGKSDGEASITLSADQLFSLIETTIYSSSYDQRSMVPKAQAALAGLAKLGYDGRDIKAVSEFFANCVQAEELRNQATRALQRLRDEFLDDRDAKNGKDSSPSAIAVTPIRASR